MALDGKLLSRARELHSEKKAAHEAALRARQSEVYAKLPRVREIDRRLRETVAESIDLAMTPGSEPAARLAAIGQENATLQAESRALLLEASFDPDYLDDAPLCLICHDTGHSGTRLCPCLSEIYSSLQAAELSSLLNLGEENFAAFSLDFYDGQTVDPRFGMTARDNMREIHAFCEKYAATFGPRSLNLFLTGDPGLGKTFLSSCIAKAVSESGFSVVYDTAGRLFSRFEAEKFGRGADADALQSEIDRYLSADLLILDDLGTEWVTPLVISTLYTLLNTRLLSKKQTIISSNFNIEALRAKYTPQIMSRLEGEYEVLTFFGKDIRKLKKEL